jgi:hypothetical protein
MSGYIVEMTRTLSLFASGIASLASIILLPKTIHSRACDDIIPTNTPQQAFAGDMLRVSAQVRMAQNEHKQLCQQEFSFAS